MNNDLGNSAGVKGRPLLPATVEFGHHVTLNLLRCEHLQTTSTATGIVVEAPGSITDKRVGYLPPASASSVNSSGKKAASSAVGACRVIPPSS